ncbi:MAG: sugar ABC transporter ATP-binding protein [Synergistaceae bacterium]|nr:sugar ABC transporter ATP-binding protein [Synergistaceae bacterium]
MKGGDVILRFERVSKTFPGVKALEDVTFDIHRGEVHVLLGENGAGKSTLIKILTGVFKADSGRILLDAKEIRPENILQSRKMGIGTVFQENSLVPHLTVAENVFLSRELKNSFNTIDWKRTYQECERWIGGMGIAIDPRVRVKALSVAEQQIVEIVKILSQEPSLIILDEPTSALSENEIDNLFSIVNKLKGEKGITFVYISHRMEEIKHIGDRASVLRDGRYIGQLPDLKAAHLDDIINMIVGRPLNEKFPKRSVQVGEAAFEVKNLSVLKTIYDVSFQVKSGEVLGLAGLVGSGRTSVAKAIIGVLRRESGEVFLDGKKVNIDSPNDAIKHGIAYLPEDRKREGLLLQKPVRENITLPQLHKFRKFGVLSKRMEKHAAHGLKKTLSIKTPSIERLVKFLSGGNQQKVVFAKWLCAKTKVYIFDEPTRGIDVGSKSEIYKIINDLAGEGAAIVVISSELPEILGVCDRIVVMCDGRVTGEMSRNDATQENIMKYAIGGA